MKLFIVIGLLLSFSAQATSFYADRERGWFWRESTAQVEEKKDIKDETSQVSKETVKSSKEILRKQGEELEESVARAVLNPNTENIKDYVVRTSKVHQQAEEFSTSFERFIWSNPEHDYTLKKPISTEAIIAKNEVDEKEKKAMLEKISHSYGLILFYSSTCSVCHKFAPIFKYFVSTYNFSVIAVSNDGGPLPGFEKYEMNTGLAQKLNLKVTPSVYLIKPSTGVITPVSYGFSSADELKNKLLVAYEKINSNN